MSFRDQPLHGVAVYNPGLLSKAELIRLFVAREPLLESLLDDLRRETGGTAQHHLLVGRRGMGKTTMLRRLAYAVEDDGALSQTWMALTFPEEQYNVSRPSDFWLNCIDALGDALEDQGRVDRVEALDARVAEIHDLADERRRHDAALDLLVGLAGELQRRLILLVDNVDLVLQRFEQQEAWALREVLSTRPEILLLGATSAPFEAFHAYEAPFYDFFRVHLLGGLDEPQTFDVLRRLSRACDAPDVERLLDTEPARIKTLRVLAGGNPRTIVLLFGLLAQGVEGSVRTDLERLLDHCTPLYKDRFERLSPQQQTIVDALAINWDPMHAGDLARKARMQVQKVSSQLTRLERDGVVEKVRIHPSTKAGFQMAERFFNIWYLMRASRRVRRRLIWLVEFLRMFFGAEELEEMGKQQLGGVRHGEREHYAEYVLALAGAIDNLSLRRALELDGIRALVEDDRLRSRLSEWFDFQGEDAELRPLVERVRLLDEARRVMMQADVEDLGVTRGELWALVGGAIGLSVREKHDFARSWSALGLTTRTLILRVLRAAAQLHHLRFGEELPSLQEALSSGTMASISDIDGARAAAEQTGERGPIGVALSQADLSIRAHLDQLDAVIDDCRAAAAWLALSTARLRCRHYEAASEAARHACSLSPSWPRPWLLAGAVSHLFLDKLDEAEGAYREALTLNPHWHLARGALVRLLIARRRFAEAEDLCREGLRADRAPALLRLLIMVRLGAQQADDELEELARELAGAEDARPTDVLTLAFVLALGGKISEALVHTRSFLDSGDALYMKGWRLLTRVCGTLAGRGHARDMRRLLLDHMLGDRWRPLSEALRAAEEGTRAILTQVAPEIQGAAESLLTQMGIHLPD